MTATAAPPFTPPLDVACYNGPTDLDKQIQLAEYLALAERVIPDEYRGRSADLLALIVQAQGMNIPVMVAIHHLFFEPDGSGGMSAQLAGSLLRRGGADWTVEAEPGKWCKLTFTFTDGRQGGVAGYTIGDARTAEVAGTDNWVRYPDDNLYARALMRGGRRFAQDMLFGFGYLRGELRDGPAAAGPAEAEPDEVSDEVRAFLSQVTNDAGTDDIRALIKTAKSKKVDLAGYHAGAGRTVEEHLQGLLRIAAAREAAAREVAVDRAHDQLDTNAELLADGPPGAAVLDAPAGEGDLKCGCPSFAVIGSGGHIDGVCTGAIH